MSETRWDFHHATGSALGAITIVGLAVRQRLAMEGFRVFGQYALVLVIDGTGFYRDVRGVESRLGPGSLITIFPDVAHHYNPDSGTVWMCSYVCFQGPVFDAWRAAGYLGEREPVRDVGPLADWVERFERFRTGPGRAVSCLHDLCFLQGMLADAAEGAGPRRSEDLDWIARAKRMVAVSPDEAPDWPAIAAQLGTGEAAFRKRFARLTGTPPARFRTASRIDAACRLISETRLTNREIAAQLGFCDEFYFSRRFKEITGRSPRSFRRHLASLRGQAPDGVD